MGNYGRETVVFFEIDQPFCALTYGTAPCTAVLGTTGTNKCHQSRATCQAPAAYAPGVLTLRFARPQEGLLKYGYGPIIPSLVDLKTTPAVINLAAMDRNVSALGQRETVTVTLEDHRYSDHLVDKYRLERKSGAASSTGVSIDPYKRGTFWGKWNARNPYAASYVCRVREGFLGQALADMRVRSYVLYSVAGPTDGTVTLVAKDLFSVIEARKAVAPVASQGELFADITSVAPGAVLSPAGIGDAQYPASGYVTIGEEAIAFTRVADALTWTTRPALNTVAADHKAQDLVQLVLAYVAQRGPDIAYDLLTKYSAIPASSIPKSTWDVLSSPLTQLYTGYVTKPTPVADLIGELCEQAGFTLWPDVSTGQVQFSPLRASAASATVSDGSWIVDGSLSVKRQDVKRVSQVWVYYGLIDPTKSLNERTNYHSRAVVADLASESAQQYGTPAIREVFSRWIPQFGRQAAQGAGDSILAIFRDPPLEVQFSVHAGRDGQLALTQPFILNTAEVQDASGALDAPVMVPVQIERGENEFSVMAQQVVLTAGSTLGGNNRTIFIENDSLNLNLRTIHDSLFAEPTGVETVTFIVVSGFTVGSASTGTAAMKTGSWPTGVVLNLITAGGRVQGKSGDGGAGGDGVFQNGSAGTGGGDALEATYPINVDNLGGEIFSGAGGSGGGAYGLDTSSGGSFAVANGGGGGAPGAGTQTGAVGVGGTNLCGPGFNSTGATRDAGGTRGAPAGVGAGFGGDGVGPGLDGNAGQNGSTGAVGGAGGSKGRYIVGNIFVTWINNGDRRGGVA